MKTMLVVMESLLLASFATVTARAADNAAAEPPPKKLQKAEVPKVVLDAVTKKYPQAKLNSFEQEMSEGRMIYEISIDAGKGKMDVEVSPEGKIVAEESVIPAA